MLTPFFTLMRETAPPEARSARLAAGRPLPPRPPRRAGGAKRRPLGRLLNVPAWPAPAAAAVCVLLLLVIVLVDVSTGADLQLAPCYFLPIILASLRFQAPGGLVVAGVSALLAVWPSPEAMRQADEPLILLANALIESAGFSFVALVTGALQRQQERLRRQRQELAEAQEWLKEDMRAAELLQAHLLRRPLPALPGVELAAELVFARGVGGDFYDLRQVDGQLALCVADVSGKGAKAALISATLRGLLDEAAGQPMEPAAFLQHLNALFAHSLPAEMFVTMFYALLDPASGALEYASAGHDPPFLCCDGVIERLPPTAPALGLLPVLPPRAGRARLHPGDTLLLYTDGLTDARRPDGSRVGDERVAACLREHVRPGVPPGVLAAELLRLACPDGLASLEDDVALIVLRRAGAAER